MSTSSLVRDRVLAEQRNTWSSAGEAWLEWCETFERGGGPVNDRLIELAGIEAGDHVLDIGSGVGQPAMTAAERVGDAGEVLGIDVSPTMVELAAGRGGGLSRVKYAVGDLLDLDLPPASFQAVLSRWALMFIPEREAVLRRIRELLVPSGIFVAAVWGPPQTAPIVGLPFQTLGPVLLAGAPATPEAANGPEQTGPYAMADLGRCRDELTSAGFAEVTAEPFDAPFWLESGERFAEFSAAILPAHVRAMLDDRLGVGESRKLWQDVAASTEPYRADDGTVRLPSQTFLLRGVVPS